MGKEHASDGTTPSAREMVFVGLNGRVAALCRYSGHEFWSWRAPRGQGYTTLIVEPDRIVVAVGGYIYCLEPTRGGVIWENPLKGYGLGIASIGSLHGAAGGQAAAAQQAAAQQAAAAAAAAAAGS